jgi:hypothetical protein
MKSKEFWGLSFYEWSIWLLRIRSLQDKRRQDGELLIELSRNWMAMYANSNRDPKKTPPYKPTDFYRLSYDTTVEKAKKTDAETLEWVKKRFEKALKRLKKGG